MGKESIDKKWVTPTQKEKGEKKTEMGLTERWEYLRTVKTEALWQHEIDEKISSGEARDEEEAKKILAEQTMDRVIEAAEEKPPALLFFRENLDGINNKDLKFGMALSSLPYDTAIKKTEKLIKALPDLKNYGDEPRGAYSFEMAKGIARSFLNLKVKSEKELDRFLGSAMEGFVTPTLILKKMGQEKAGPDTIKKLLKKYEGGMFLDFGEIDLFGENGILSNFSEDEQEKMLTQIFDKLEEQTETSIKRAEESKEDSWMRLSDSGITWESARVEPRLKHLQDAARAGIILSDWKERLKKIQEATYHYPRRYSETVVRNTRENIARVGTQLEELSGEAKDITGRGLEFVKSEYGPGVKAYLNGELISTVINGEFGKVANNEDTVAWVVSEIIDEDVITGTQTRDIVYAWKKGWKEPRQVFEDHAWSTEYYFRVYPPEVTPDGKIKIKRIRGNKEINEEIEVD
jgi:hypothetical protein